MQIFININGEINILDVECTYTIEMIKLEIENATCISHLDQLLVFSNKLLLDNKKTLYDYNIDDLSTLYLIRGVIGG